MNLITVPLLASCFSSAFVVTKNNTKQIETFQVFPDSQPGVSQGFISPTNVYFSDKYMGPNVFWSSEKTNNQFIHRLSNTNQNNFPTFNLDGSLKDSGLTHDDTLMGPQIIWSSGKIVETIPKMSINDSIISKEKTWSSEKVVNEIGKISSSFQPRIKQSVPGSIAVFNSGGSAVDSQFFIDDKKPADFTTIWSSKKIMESLPGMNAVDNTIVGVNLWDSSKIDSELAKIIANTQPLGSPTSDKHIAIYNNKGVLTDGMFKMDDMSPAAPNILWSSQKIASSVPIVNDSLSTSNLNVWSSSKTSEVLSTKVDKILNADGFLSSFKADGNLQSSGFKVNDTTTSINTLWSSSKIQQMTDMNFQKITIPVVENTVAVLDSGGQVADSGMIVNDSIAADIDVLWSSKKISDMFVPADNILDKQAGVLIGYEKDGIIGGKFRVDDMSSAGPTIIWSSEKLMNMKNTNTRASGVSSVSLGNITVAILSTPFRSIGIRAVKQNTTIAYMIESVGLMLDVKNSSVPISTTDFTLLTDDQELQNVTFGHVIKAFVHDQTANIVYAIKIYVHTTNILNSFIRVEEL